MKTYEIDTTNKYMVGSSGEFIYIMKPVRNMTQHEALNLAAYLITMIDIDEEEIRLTIDAIKNT